MKLELSKFARMQLTNMVIRYLTPKYSLDKVKSVSLRKISFSKAAARDIDNLGYTDQDVKDCIDGLQESNFVKQVVYDYGVADVYFYCHELEPIDDISDPTCDELYLKFEMLEEETEIYFLSFHLKHC